MSLGISGLPRRLSNRVMLRQLIEFVFGRPEPARLPDRVRLVIRRQEQQSEVLVCLAQFGAIAFFGTFYAAAPKTFPIDAPFEPVPVTLVAYAVFTAFRLSIATRRPLAPWLLAASIVIDIAVLVGLIWSFHLQYDQPPGLYLKAPTLLYLFIIIALRALRFDPRWVLLAGGAAVLGWSLLVLYALQRSEVTRSYVEYMTSLKILIGAEVDKLVSMAAVTLLLAVVVVRARRLLVASVMEATAATELSRFFASDIAEAIKSADQAIRPGEGVVRPAAAMFVDLRGFTELAGRLEPSELLELLGEYQRHVATAVHEHNGSITTYLGDGVMVTFGATRESVTWAADAVGATQKLLERLESWRSDRQRRGLPAPGVGIGVCAGDVIFGAIGDERRLEYAVIGDPVNRAAKLQNHTKAARVRALAAAELVPLARAQGLSLASCEIITGAEVAGIPGQVDLAVLG
jgi:adenylate cyclase